MIATVLAWFAKLSLGPMLTSPTVRIILATLLFVAACSWALTECSRKHEAHRQVRTLTHIRDSLLTANHILKAEQQQAQADADSAATHYYQTQTTIKAHVQTMAPATRTSTNRKLLTDLDL